ncbi:hypothetical protein LB505_002700 [Fusarium chuoi]|nr:hypothetical protein LB505_002700 [Fusarium chuoi]
MFLVMYTFKNTGRDVMSSYCEGHLRLASPVVTIPRDSLVTCPYRPPTELPYWSMLISMPFLPCAVKYTQHLIGNPYVLPLQFYS